MKLSRQEKITYLQPTRTGQGLVAGFTTRNGGVSRAPYNSLNLGFNTADQQVHVDGNRSTATAVRIIDFETKPLNSGKAEMDIEPMMQKTAVRGIDL